MWNCNAIWTYLTFFTNTARQVYIAKQHRISKNVPPLACYNFDMSCKRILIFFSQIYYRWSKPSKTLYSTTSNNLCSCANCQNAVTRKLHSSLKCRISALTEFNQLLDFFNLFDSRLILRLPYDSLNIIINAFSLGLLRGVVQDKRSRERCKRWAVLDAQCTSALSSGFHILQGNAEALDRWGGKAKQRLISYFFSNTSAKKYRNRIVCVKIIASQR